MGRAGAKAAFLARPLHRANGCAPGGGEWRKPSRICGEFAPRRTAHRAQAAPPEISLARRQN
jgi:hypothetical protein